MQGVIPSQPDAWVRSPPHRPATGALRHGPAFDSEQPTPNTRPLQSLCACSANASAAVLLQVWLGDLAYMDMPLTDCEAKQNKHHPDCMCEVSVLAHPPESCKAGDVQNAQRKVEGIIRSKGYQAFLEYMCPGFLAKGDFPPAGRDPFVCPRPILGVYDDHDFGVNNGNGKQLANRAEIKQVPPLQLRCNTASTIHCLAHSVRLTRFWPSHKLCHGAGVPGRNRRGA